MQFQSFSIYIYKISIIKTFLLVHLQLQMAYYYYILCNVIYDTFNTTNLFWVNSSLPQYQFVTQKYHNTVQSYLYIHLILLETTIIYIIQYNNKKYKKTQIYIFHGSISVVGIDIVNIDKSKHTGVSVYISRTIYL